MDRIVLVSSAPGPRTTSLGVFDGVMGRRLAELAGIAHEGLGDRFELVNVLAPVPMVDVAEGRPPLAQDHLEAASRELLPHLAGRAVIVAGAAVSRAMGVPTYPFAAWRTKAPFAFVATIPHPSHLNLAWNDRALASRIREFLRESAALTDPVAEIRLVTDITSISGVTDKTPEEFMTYQSAAEMLGITVGHLRVLVHRKKVPHLRVASRTVRFRPGDLRKYMDARSVYPTEKRES